MSNLLWWRLPRERDAWTNRWVHHERSFHRSGRNFRLWHRLRMAALSR